jgi:hypothetical protein
VLMYAWRGGGALLSLPKDTNMRIPDRLIKCVGFVSHELPTLDFIGTVFIVGIHDGTPGNALLHIVTAKHVAEVFDPGSCIIAMNGKDGKPVFAQTGEDIQWFYHPTEPSSVDVAVAPFASARLAEYDIEWIPEEMFATPDRIKEFGLGAGTAPCVSPYSPRKPMGSPPARMASFRVWSRSASS